MYAGARFARLSRVFCGVCVLASLGCFRLSAWLAFIPLHNVFGKRKTYLSRSLGCCPPATPKGVYCICLPALVPRSAVPRFQLRTRTRAIGNGINKCCLLSFRSSAPLWGFAPVTIGNNTISDFRFVWCLCL